MKSGGHFEGNALERRSIAKVCTNAKNALDSRILRLQSQTFSECDSLGLPQAPRDAWMQTLISAWIASLPLFLFYETTTDEHSVADLKAGRAGSPPPLVERLTQSPTVMLPNAKF